MNGEIFKQLANIPTRPFQIKYYGKYLHPSLPIVFKNFKLSPFDYDLNLS